MTDEAYFYKLYIGGSEKLVIAIFVNFADASKFVADTINSYKVITIEQIAGRPN